MQRLRPLSENTQPHEKGRPNRRSVAHLSAIAAMNVAALFGASGNSVLPVEQPKPYALRIQNSSDVEAGPFMNMEDLMISLKTPHEVQKFLKENTISQPVSFPIEFAETYRRNPQEFQNANWVGCCNNFAEFACEWGAAHGHKMYLLSLWPKEPLGRLHESWHQFAVICLKNEKEYIIFDNREVVHWESSLEEYVEKNWKELCILPTCGKVEWKRTQDNFLARMAWQIGSNVDSMQESPYESLTPQPAKIATAY